MTGDMERSTDPGHEDPRDGEGLLYDLAKFLTTLSLLALGGVLTIADSADTNDIPLFNIALITIALSLAAVLSVATASSIAIARWSGQENKSNFARYVQATIALLGVGLGMFFFMWIDKLN
jgi:hypothetical protein